MHADVFSVIADSTRRRIVRLLAEQTHTVGAVVEKLGMSQPTISKHLKVLREAGVVSAVVEGQRRLYSLNPEVFTEITDWVDEILEAARASAAAHAPVALPGGESFSPRSRAVPWWWADLPVRTSMRWLNPARNSTFQPSCTSHPMLRKTMMRNPARKITTIPPLVEVKSFSAALCR